MNAKTLYVEVVANLGQFPAKMGAAAAAVGQVGHASAQAGRDLETLAASSERSRRVLSNVALVAGGVLAAGFVLSAKAAVDLERDLRNVATISGDVQKHFGDYESALIAMSTRLPQSADMLAKGLYDIVSSGFQAKDALTILDAAATSASAGLTDTATASRAITAVLNAYGLAASQAGDVSDILFQTVNKGVVTFEQAANSIGFFAGTAAAAKVPFDDVASAFAAITLSGFNAAESATRLNQLLSHLLKPSVDLQAALHNLGYESGAQALQVDGLHKVILRLSAAQGTAADTALKLFPDIRAAGGYMALTAANGKNYAETFDAIASSVNRAEAAHKALAQQQQSASYQMTLLKNDATALGLQFMQAMMPALHAVIGAGQEFLALWQAMPTPLRDVVGVLGVVAAAVLILGGAFLRLKPTIDTMRASMTRMRTEGSALPGVMSGAGGAAAALAAVLTVATIIYGSYAAQKAKAKQITEEFTSALQAEAEGQKGATDAAIVKQIVDDGDIERLKKAGISVVDFVNAVKGVPVSAPDPFAKQVSTSIDLTTHLAALHAEYNHAKTASTDLAQSQDQTTAAAQKQTHTFGTLASLIATNKQGAEQLTDSQKALRDSFAKMTDSAAAAKTVLTSLSNDALGAAIDKTTAKAKFNLETFEKNLRSAVRAQTDWDANLTTIAKRGAPELADALRGMGEKGVALAKQLADGSNTQLNRVKSEYASLAPSARKSLQAFTAELLSQVTARADFASNLATLAARGRDALVAEFKKMGPEAAPLAAQAVHATSRELNKLTGIIERQSQLDGAAFDNGLTILSQIAAEGGRATVASLAKQFKGGDLSAMRDVLKEIEKNVKDIPTRHVIDILLGKVPTGIDIPIHVVDKTTGHRTGVTYNAEGHIAQVAPAGAMRVWAEPETGGEAYIPLAPTKRPRSVQILGQVADHFGLSLVAAAGGKILSFAPGGIVDTVGRTAQPGLTLGASTLTIGSTITQVAALVAAWDAALAHVDAASQRNDLVTALRRANADLRHAQTTKSKTDDVNAAQAVVDAHKQLAAFDRTARVDAERRRVEATQARLEAAKALATNREQWAFDHMNEGQQLAYLDRRMAKEKRYSDDWMRDAQARDQIVQRQADAAAKIVGNKDAWAFEHASAQQQIDLLTRRMATEKKYSDEWMSDARAREQIVQQQQQDAAKVTGNKAAWEFEHLNAQQQIDLLTKRMAVEAQFSDDWMSDAKAREQLIQTQQDAAQKLADNQAAWQFDHLNAQQQLDALAKRMAGEQEYSDQWMSDAKAREQLQAQIDKDAADALQKQQDALNAYADSLRQAAVTEADTITSAVQQRIDSLLQVTRGLDLYSGLVMRNTDLAAAGKTLTQIGLLTSAMQAYTANATDIGSVTKNVQLQTAALQQWNQGLTQLRSKGLTEEAIAALGLGSGPDKLAEVQRFNAASLDQIAALNRAIAAQTAAAGGVAGQEQAGGYGPIGDAIVSAGQTFQQAVAQAAATWVSATGNAPGTQPPLLQTGPIHIDARGAPLGVGDEIKRAIDASFADLTQALTAGVGRRA